MSVWPYNFPRVWGGEHSEMQWATPKEALEIFLHSHALISDGSGGVEDKGWGLTVNQCPEIKVLIDILGQDTLYCR